MEAWSDKLINKLTPRAIAAQHVYYCGNRNGTGPTQKFNETFSIQVSGGRGGQPSQIGEPN